MEHFVFSCGLQIFNTTVRQSNVKCWLRIHGPPQEYWRDNILFAIARGVGVPLALDVATTNRDYGHFVDLTLPLREHSLDKCRHKHGVILIQPRVSNKEGKEQGTRNSSRGEKQIAKQYVPKGSHIMTCLFLSWSQCFDHSIFVQSQQKGGYMGSSLILL